MSACAPSPHLTPLLADAFMRVALDNVQREYPNKPDHVLNSAHDLRAPRALHPIFFGSYDWHSCVHMHWTIARCLRAYPTLPAARVVHEWFDGQITPGNVAQELAYLDEPSRGTFERPYGWAWLLKLQSELLEGGEATRHWAMTLQPLADAFVARLRAWLYRATYPVRHGVHGNSAFALMLALDYARAARHDALSEQLGDIALRWFGGDNGYDARFEPSGEDFLSPALTEAALMADIMDPPNYADWLARFLPQLARGEPDTLFTPAAVSDRSDARIAHLDGLNLSRAWCARLIAMALPAGDARRDRLEAMAIAHAQAALPHVIEGHYAGTHWLASFALLYLLS